MAAAVRCASPTSRMSGRSASCCCEACLQAGIPRNPDFNGAQQEGAGYYQTTTNNRRRWSTAAAYLRPARNRANLVVQTHAHATRVLIENGRAVGVEYRTPQGLRTARATGEVIVSGGAYGSPQLLLLSGIGPAQHLQDMGIPVLHDLPGVGSNLHDHFNTYCAWRISRSLSLNVLHHSLPHQLVAGMKYVFWRGGPMSGNGLYVGALVRSDPSLERPDLQMNISAWSTIDRTRDGIISHPFPAFAISPVHLRPEGRGTVRLKSPDPLAPPEIRFNFLRSDYDMQAIITGIAHRPQNRQPAGAEGTGGRGGAARAGRRHARNSLPTRCGCAACPTCIRWEAAAWAMGRTQWSIRGCACTGSAGCAWRMPRSCRRSSPATPTRRAS